MDCIASIESIGIPDLVGFPSRSRIRDSVGPFLDQALATRVVQGARDAVVRLLQSQGGRVRRYRPAGYAPRSRSAAGAVQTHTMADSLEHALELTTSALKDGPVDLGIHGGLVEVLRWQRQLDTTEAPALQEIDALLAELRGELESDAPNGSVLADLMRRLGAKVLAAAEVQDEGERRSRLVELGNLLRQTAVEAE
ncbi:MAG: hypothetical protein JWN95_3297 [Frankiales bacterium]|nr:hypothetical protein [Frankiales bacterium]